MVKRVAIVAGEISGDMLGADLIRSLKEIWPDAMFFGIGGERMIQEGFESRFDMERLSVMGLVEPLKRLPELLRIRKSIAQECINNQPDVFIGIDAPDFNTSLELKIREAGVKTVHYVSPSVWAWRKGRIKKIKRAVDLMLTLLPFEADFYRKNQVPVSFVGHPLAYQLTPSNKRESRNILGLSLDGIKIAIMPGSRGSEVKLMADDFFHAATLIAKEIADCEFIVPAVNEARRTQIEAIALNFPELAITIVDRQSREVMSAADAVLLTSGTTALEAMLLGRPMVVAYKLGGLSYSILKHFVDTPFMSLPNLIAGRELVPEFLQEAVNPRSLADAIKHALTGEQTIAFKDLATTLKQGGGKKAAQAIEDLCKR